MQSTPRKFVASLASATCSSVDAAARKFWWTATTTTLAVSGRNAAGKLAMTADAAAEVASPRPCRPPRRSQRCIRGAASASSRIPGRPRSGATRRDERRAGADATPIQEDSLSVDVSSWGTSTRRARLSTPDSLIRRWGPPFAMVAHGDLTLAVSRSSASRALADGSVPAPGGWNRVSGSTSGAARRSVRAAGCVAVKRHRPRRRQIVEDPSGNPIELFEPGN